MRFISKTILTEECKDVVVDLLNNNKSINISIFSELDKDEVCLRIYGENNNKVVRFYFQGYNKTGAEAK